ncbi:ferredoxin [Streptomyces sp. NPDC007369]|uniref:ferredoxin n=1 Tax=Streptomyces sp. NPDC007369 TaxID=3154589 RepID=UPI0033C6AC2E
MTHTPYWDPLPTVRAAAGHPLPQWTPGCGFAAADWSAAEPGRWEKRSWRDVPGPFYAADTDTCWTGRLCAPGHVMYDDEYGQEFVYRQPRTQQETYDLLCAAECDPFAGYGADGDAHWTPELVRDWWRERGRVREWAARIERTWSVSTNEWEREAAGGARAYLAHIDGDLADYLRGYLFWLAERRPAGPDEALPRL